MISKVPGSRVNTDTDTYTHTGTQVCVYVCVRDSADLRPGIQSHADFKGPSYLSMNDKIALNLWPLHTRWVTHKRGGELNAAPLHVPSGEKVEFVLACPH